jgi:hypothetical protein
MDMSAVIIKRIRSDFMKLMFHILSFNKKLDIDNRLISERGIRSKLNEEYNEVINALVNYGKNANLNNLIEVVRETFDLIQICILILWKCHKKAIEINEPNLIQAINIEHKDKLVNREWNIETGIEVKVLK